MENITTFLTLEDLPDRGFDYPWRKKLSGRETRLCLLRSSILYQIQCDAVERISTRISFHWSPAPLMLKSKFTIILSSNRNNQCLNGVRSGQKQD